MISRNWATNGHTIVFIFVLGVNNQVRKWSSSLWSASPRLDCNSPPLIFSVPQNYLRMGSTRSSAESSPWPRYSEGTRVSKSGAENPCPRTNRSNPDSPWRSVYRQRTCIRGSPVLWSSECVTAQLTGRFGRVTSVRRWSSPLQETTGCSLFLLAFC